MDELQIKMDLVKQAKGRTSHQQSTTFLSRTQLSLLCPQKRITQSKVHFASYCVLSPKANSKPLLLAYFQKSDAVDKVDLWVQTGVERKSVSKLWYGNQSCLVKMARVSYLKQVFHMKWTCTQQEQEEAAEFHVGCFVVTREGITIQREQAIIRWRQQTFIWRRQRNIYEGFPRQVQKLDLPERSRGGN